MWGDGEETSTFSVLGAQYPALSLPANESSPRKCFQCREGLQSVRSGRRGCAHGRNPPTRPHPGDPYPTPAPSPAASPGARQGHPWQGAIPAAAGTWLLPTWAVRVTERWIPHPGPGRKSPVSCHLPTLAARSRPSLGDAE